MKRRSVFPHDKKGSHANNEKNFKRQDPTNKIVSRQVKQQEEATVFYSFSRKVIQQERSRLPTTDDWNAKNSLLELKKRVYSSESRKKDNYDDNLFEGGGEGEGCGAPVLP